jgi:predicted pyridoxine 5'-phosphate oxidase superfamily flavin-nucleotide-binding protein
MGSQFAKTMFSPAAKRLQERHGSRAQYERLSALGPRDEALGDFEQQFIAARDSFYLASVTEDGWPYIQHRGGPAGFLHVLDTNDRVALFLMDYPHQARLKIIGHARIVELGADPALEARLDDPNYSAKIERMMVIDVAAYDWNCSQHITPRFTEQEFAHAI